MKNIFDRIDISGINYQVVVTTRFGSTLCSQSGDLVFHTTPILNVRDAADSEQVGMTGQVRMTKQFEQTRKSNQSSLKRRG